MAVSSMKPSMLEMLLRALISISSVNYSKLTARRAWYRLDLPSIVYFLRACSSVFEIIAEVEASASLGCSYSLLFRALFRVLR